MASRASVPHLQRKIRHGRCCLRKPRIATGAFAFLVSSHPVPPRLTDRPRRPSVPQGDYIIVVGIHDDVGDLLIVWVE